MGIVNDLFGTGRSRKKKTRRRSQWVNDGSHRTKAAAKKRAKALRREGYKTRIGKLPNHTYYVFKK